MVKRLTLLVIVIFFCSTQAFAAPQLPGKGVVVKPARATWNTGFFHAALVERGLEELGYTVKKAKDLPNALAYKSIAMGDVDYWPNTWLPNHKSYMGGDFFDKTSFYGYVVKAGGLQGYLVSKISAEKLNITSLDDFKRPEVIAEFDRNGDGKADLTACPPGWGCERDIDRHLKIYGLKKYVKPIKAAYEASMAAAYAAQQAGEPIFFYTWTPNWTVFKLKPGEDVVWINVPEIIPSEEEKDFVDIMTVENLCGAVSSPLKMGFAASDIRIVANKAFAEKNPAARRFFEVFKMPLEDINKQNSLLNSGEKSNKDIQRHVNEWIAENKATWNGWLEEARKAAE
ncbi:glycine betaine/L-proline ABC transporter substrate-binding protein ProX [Halodesulfovibrio marinisediminis]|uniref:Glycine betaine/proline transport system substrate-binding protein n=1 Tax=Halodesulfovibrio marinisediminis DSM 17456 TaxID=1121457 RepID=A0A1N6GQ41_9BACT|nr:glycine betaine/L-proline ABC transporter substrate-binding protein ProX [Halodesulfovibrio marinisediminis]SIO09661.1 glycine betaine/proline transport system substrate-binding protein [Halodesulfovibrio marinisediminis DSM 17456]